MLIDVNSMIWGLCWAVCRPFVDGCKFLSSMVFRESDVPACLHQLESFTTLTPMVRHRYNSSLIMGMPIFAGTHAAIRGLRGDHGLV